MLLSHLARVIARRWVIVAVGLLATLGCAAAAVKVVPPEYSLTATVLLVPPVDTAEPGANPYLSLGGLTAPTEVLARAMSDPGTEKALRDGGATGTWTVERDYMTSAPILIVTTQDATVAQAQRTASIVLKAIPTQLQTLQAAVNVPTSAMITSSVVNQDADQQRVLKPLIRALMVILIGGLVLTIGIAALVDSLARRRIRPRTDGRSSARRRSPRTELSAVDHADETDLVRTRGARRRRSFDRTPDPAPTDEPRRVEDELGTGGELTQTGHGPHRP